MPDNRRNSVNLKNNQRFSYYVDGNTVRKLQPETYPLPDEDLKRQQRERARRRRAEREKARRQEAIRKNREKAQRMNLGYTLFLIFSAVLTVAACVIYLNMQSAITRKSGTIAALESELSTLVNENSAAQERLNSAVDLSDVYQKAINEFGMTAITEAQIHYYSNDNQDYIKQYQEIPSDN